MINDEETESVSEIKCLVVIIDEKLSWKKQTFETTVSKSTPVLFHHRPLCIVPSSSHL